MAGAAPDVLARDEPGTAGELDTYGILILDALGKQSLTSARSLGRAGIRVALGESVGQYSARPQPPSWRSRYCSRAVALPDYNSDPAAYIDAIIAFVSDHSVKVVLPTGDASITMLAAHRERFAKLDCTLVLASDAALEIANDKNRTLEVASRLGIAYPRSVQINGVEDLRVAEAEFGYPFVLKPTISWTGRAEQRVYPVEVVDEADAADRTARFLATGCEVLAQQFASGRREGVTLFMADGEVLASCGAAALRTVPPLGGVSAMRESIPIPHELLDASVRLVTAIGLEGPCEVEFRRDASGRPLLMEVNARLAGTLENASQSGVDFPLIIWQWATGQPVQPVQDYRIGVRTRWLGGDLRWLFANILRPSRLGRVPTTRALWQFASEFARTRHYDYIDRHDIRPALAEMQDTVAFARNQWAKRKQRSDDRKTSVTV
jgi:predicted ATP-grasp superfamily ATP-dependent carboligase